MIKAKNDSDVKIHFKGTLNDGTIFDNSKDRGQTMDFKLGGGNVLPAFENHLVGMGIGQSKNFKIPCNEAYGEHMPEAIVQIPRDSFPDDMELVVGSKVQGKNPTGHTVVATIASIDDEGIMLDHNHPLAGEDLNFEVELVEIL